MSGCPHCGDAHAEGAKNCPRTGNSMALAGPCGRTIDRYLVERLIAAGGMGEVYRARHVTVGQPVALKLLRSELAQDAEVLERFAREARTAAAIGNEHITRVTDFGVADDGRAFMVMELLEGQDLEALLAEQPVLPTGRAVAIVLQVLDALAAAHDAGVVHRDVKPANVFLVARAGGADDFVKLLDFGISGMRVAGAASLTRSGSLLGTPCYMAPEQFRGAKETGPASDLFSAAVLLYRALAGVLPFEGDTYVALMQSVSTGVPRPLAARAPSLPPALVAAIERGLSREPGDRFVDARAFSAAIRAATAQLAPAQGPATDARAFGATAFVATAYATPAPAVQTTARPPSVAPRPSAPPYQAPPTPSPFAMRAPTPATAPPPPYAYPPPPRAAAPDRTRGLALVVAVGFVVVAIALVNAWWFLFREPPDASHRSPVATPGVTVASVAPAPPATPKPDAGAGVGAAADDDDDDDPEDAVMLATMPFDVPAVVPGTVVFGPPQLVGQVDGPAVQRLFAGARSTIAATCRRAGAGERVVVMLTSSHQGLGTALPAPQYNHGNPHVARCVANTLLAAGAGNTGLGAGIAFVGVAVPGA